MKVGFTSRETSFDSPPRIMHVLRMLRETWSDAHTQNYMACELILLIRAEHLADFQRDFAVYEKLPEPQQRQFLEQLRTTMYTGRALSDADIPVAHAPAPAVESEDIVDPESGEDDTPQMSLF